MDAEIKRFLSGSGSGYGAGDGYGAGSGYGDGDGYGAGSGYGDGSGDGAGYGSGSGDGDGYGYGSGDGDGYGSGYGDGAGYGDGSGAGDGAGSGYKIKCYRKKQVYYIDDIPCVFKFVHNNWAAVEIINADFTTRQAIIAKLDGVYAHGSTVKKAFASALDKVMDSMSDDEKKARFLSEFPDYDTPYKNADFFDWHHIITGSCEMGREQFARDRGIDMTGKMTVRDFIELTKDSYEGEKVAALSACYENKEETH